MREIDEAREALDRVEKNLDRYRWILSNPIAARNALNKAIEKNPHGPTMTEVSVEIDATRAYIEASLDAWIAAGTPGLRKPR